MCLVCTEIPGSAEYKPGPWFILRASQDGSGHASMAKSAIQSSAQRTDKGEYMFKEIFFWLRLNAVITKQVKDEDITVVPERWNEYPDPPKFLLPETQADYNEKAKHFLAVARGLPSKRAGRISSQG